MNPFPPLCSVKGYILERANDALSFLPTNLHVILGVLLFFLVL